MAKKTDSFSDLSEGTVTLFAVFVAFLSMVLNAPICMPIWGYSSPTTLLKYSNRVALGTNSRVGRCKLL